VRGYLGYKKLVSHLDVSRRTPKLRYRHIKEKQKGLTRAMMATPFFSSPQSRPKGGLGQGLTRGGWFIAWSFMVLFVSCVCV